MYDPDEFRHGIEVLRGVEEGSALGSRDSVLAVLLGDLEGMKGDAHAALLNYLDGLSRWPENPVDFTRLNDLHYEVALSWGSGQISGKAAERKKQSDKNKRGARVNAGMADLRRQAICDWVDKYLNQRVVNTTLSASELATRLLRHDSDFQWPSGCGSLSHGRVRKVISAHLKEQKPTS